MDRERIEEEDQISTEVSGIVKRIKMPDKSQPERMQWLNEVFKRIIDKCKARKIKNFTLEIDYGGEVTVKEVKMPCIKSWTLNEMKKWVKNYKRKTT